MPLLVVPLLIVVALSVVLLLVPLSILQRYRMGTARQRARGWLATINVAGLSLSAVLFLVSAAMTTLWVAGAFTYAALGFAGGLSLGIVGLRLTRWEWSAGALYYTPSRPLVTVVMLLVAGRVGYGFWRAWESWRAGMRGESWLIEAGVAGALAAGAIVLGYYLAYSIGVRRRYRDHLRHRFP